MSAMQCRKRAKVALTCLLSGVLLVNCIAGLYTAFYYWGAMPRTPQPQTGRVYRAGAAYNTAVYVTKGEFDWVNFLEYDMAPISLICGLFVCFLWIRPKQRR